MHSVRRFLAIIGMSILVASCSSKKTVGGATCDQQFWNGTFSTCLPSGWKILTQENLKTLGVPEETVAAFQREEARAGQFDTVTVTKEPLPSDVTTPDYSKANILAVSSLPDYKLIDKSSVYVDRKESSLHVFTARLSAEAPLRRYYQVSAATDGLGYTFTGSFPLGIADSDANEVGLIMRNVSFIDPTNVKAAK